MSNNYLWMHSRTSYNAAKFYDIFIYFVRFFIWFKGRPRNMEKTLGEIAIAIQARTSSKRFPNKVLAPFLNTTVILHLVRSLQILNLPIFVLTSEEESDTPLADYLAKKNISFYRGSLNSVAERYASFMKYSGFENLIRISGDSPLLHPSLVELCIETAKESSGFDLVTNVFPRTFPSGQSVELLTFSLLSAVLENSSNSSYLEHVTSYVYSNAESFCIRNFSNPFTYSLPKMSLDFPEELSSLEILGRHILKEDLYRSSWMSTAQSIHGLTLPS
jgi:spore coat polysaccharide biosynthesis protein SpsF